MGITFEGPVKPTQQLTSFHITDLLERSLLGNRSGAEQGKLRQVVELYKRQLRADKDLGFRSRLMIRNFRVHSVKDEASELSPEILQLCTINKGTSIPCWNSVLRPEVARFGTKVTDKFPRAWPALFGDGEPWPNRSARDGLTLEVPFDLRAVELSQHEEGAQVFQEEAMLADQDGSLASQHNVFERTAVAEEAGGTKEPGAPVVDLDGGLSSRPFTAQEAGDVEALAAVNGIFDKWLRNA